MRLRKIKDAKTKLLEYSNLVIDNPEEYRGRWSGLFQNNNPIYLEIGMGKGKFLMEHAKLNQNINYIGIELSDSIVLKAARVASSLELNNLKLINFDASKLSNIFKDNEISKLFLNFSDPWPKTRHEKRRLTADSFLNSYKKVLIEEGIIEMKTDNRKLFEYSLIQFNKHNFEFLELDLNLHEKKNEEIITTEYEEKFKRLGSPIYYVKVII